MLFAFLRKIYHEAIRKWKFFLSDDSRSARKNSLLLKNTEGENDQAVEDEILSCNDDSSLETMELLLDIHPIVDPQTSQRVLRQQIGAHEMDIPCRFLMGTSGGMPVAGGPFRKMTIQYGSSVYASHLYGVLSELPSMPVWTIQDTRVELRLGIGHERKTYILLP